ncbi:MAG TPA: hypothetical protein VJ183_07090 [Chloroflexia bacterium]|nr:hypothetical protein [Chloroflexia bacterium]
MKQRWFTGAATFGAAALIFGAAAIAQPPTSGASVVAQATGTATVASTGTVITGTSVTTSTATAVGTAPATIVVSGTVGASPTVVPTIVISSNLYVAGGGPFAYAHPAFQRTWDRTDHPVQQGQVSRTFFWGPGPNTPGLFEQYNEDPLGRRLRLVQYFDKSRMELNDPGARQDQPFFVTNGLLTVDLISGQVQVGEKDFLPYRNACIPMSGDPGDQFAPTYFAFQKVSVSSQRVDTHPATNRTGQKVIETIDRNGTTGTDPAKSVMTGTDIVYFDATVKHNIPRVFWDFLNASGPVHDANHAVVREQLINPWFFASGLPISEAYWTRATIKGVVKDVMIQAFERRALTYVPSNPTGFQVEMANIGQHYFDWRYRNGGFCPNDPVGTPTPPVPAGTTTPVATTTAGATGTAVATGTAGTPVATGTTVAATATAVVTSTTGATSTMTVQPIGTPLP